MSTSFIDGTVAELVPYRSRGGVTVYKFIRFVLEDGSSRTLTKAAVSRAVADELSPGTRGRFYLFNAFDIRGIHGVRLPDGRAVCAFPGTNQKLFLILIVVSLLWMTLRVTVEGDLPLLGVALAIFGVIGWFLMGKSKTESLAQFEGDAAYPGVATAALR